MLLLWCHDVIGHFQAASRLHNISWQTADVSGGPTDVAWFLLLSVEESFQCFSAEISHVYRFCPCEHSAVRGDAPAGRLSVPVSWVQKRLQRFQFGYSWTNQVKEAEKSLLNDQTLSFKNYLDRWPYTPTLLISVMLQEAPPSGDILHYSFSPWGLRRYRGRCRKSIIISTFKTLLKLQAVPLISVNQLFVCLYVSHWMLCSLQWRKSVIVSFGLLEDPRNHRWAANVLQNPDQSVEKISSGGRKWEKWRWRCHDTKMIQISSHFKIK